MYCSCNHDYFSGARSLLVSTTWGSYFPTSPAVGLHAKKELKVLSLVQQNLESAEQLLQQDSQTGCLTAVVTAAIHWRKWS